MGLSLAKVERAGVGCEATWDCVWIVEYSRVIKKVYKGCFYDINTEGLLTA